MSSDLTSATRPVTDATLTVRVIKSFKYRTEKSLVLHHIDLTQTTVRDLKNIAKRVLYAEPSWKSYRNVVLDTLKLYSKAHGAKTSNLIINLDHDDWILDDEDKILFDLSFENETEVSFFNRKDYEAFKVNPEIAWDG